MDAGVFGPVRGMGYEGVLGTFTYFPNGTSNPSVAAVTGPLAQWVSSITYGATGQQTIVFKTGFQFAQTPRFSFAPSADQLSNAYEVSQIGAYNATTRTLVIQQRQGTTGVAVASNASNFVTITVVAWDTTGK